jgi:hypothetical protein
MKIIDKIKLKFNRIYWCFLSEKNKHKRLKNICLDYFEENPDKKNILIQKAKHRDCQDWKAKNKYSHHFGLYLGKMRCVYCKCPIPDEKQDDASLYECPRTEYICGIDEWEEFKLKVDQGAYNPYYNLTTKKVDKMKKILKDEHELYIQTVERGKVICLKKWAHISEITGKDLSWLKNTHGFGLEDVEGIYEEPLTKKQKEDFNLEYEKHCATGKLGEIKTIISVNYV